MLCIQPPHLVRRRLLTFSTLLVCDFLPLLRQADKGHWQALRVLTETAAYVDMQDTAGRSVLYLAAQKGYSRCVEVLLAQGASCLLNDNRLMWTPIHVAGMQLRPGRRGSAALLLIFTPSVCDRCAHLLVPHFTTAANGHSDCLRMMIDYGEEGDLTNVADKFGQ